ncbi:hypothetical protein MMC24_004786 [Lignoscripta atroalba]|nr:hypothetical protein [Lignoscripta atroalba]
MTAARKLSGRFPLHAGFPVRARSGTFTVSRALRPDVWLATDENQKTVILKTAPATRLEAESKVLKHFQNHASFRQLLDRLDDPPVLVLEYLEKNLMEAAHQQRLSRPVIKRVAKGVLEALSALHERGLVHTDIKTDNVLVDCVSGPHRFSKVKLADLGDAVDMSAGRNTEGHPIGSAFFRSPEALLGMQWTQATDIWSFGTLLISLLWEDNWFIFAPSGGTEAHRIVFEVLKRQHQYFGPFPETYLAASEQAVTLLIEAMEATLKLTPFSMACSDEISKDDRDFVCRIMKLDASERPSASDLLQDKWFMES